MVKTGKFEFSTLVDSILTDLARLAVQQTITQPIFNALSQGLASFGGLSSPRTPPGSGIGPGAGTGLRIPGAATGGSFPASYPIVVGEAGPEAILPLKRGAGGILGVEGGSSVQVNVINNANGTTATATERMEGGTRIVDVMIEQVKSAIAGDFTRGGPVAMAAERTYGLSRAAGAY
jgi:phage-related minor tail protein